MQNNVSGNHRSSLPVGVNYGNQERKYQTKVGVVIIMTLLAYEDVIIL